MIRTTYGQAKEYLARYALGVGMSPSSDVLLELVNDAVQELMYEGEWPGIVDQWLFKTDPLRNGELACPSFIERVLGVTLDGVPREIRGPWFEFCMYGPGNVHNELTDSQGNVVSPAVGWTGWMVDRGEACTRYVLPEEGGPWKVRVYAYGDEDTDDVSPEILVRGLDEDGMEVRTEPTEGTWISGENIAIDGAETYTESVGEFASLVSVMKPVTRHPVKLTAWNGSEEVELSVYDWDETNPSYRRYFFPELWKDFTGKKDRIVRARCRRKFKPIQDDSDEMLIGNKRAVAEMMIAQWKRSTDSGDEYAMHKQTAIDLMKKETINYLGKDKTPPVTFTKGFSLFADLPIVR